MGRAHDLVGKAGLLGGRPSPAHGKQCHDHFASTPTTERTAKRKRKEEMKEGGKKIQFLPSKDVREAIPKG